MKQVRLGVFETNSSSTHSLTMCAKEDYDKWVNGQLFLTENSKFVERKDYEGRGEYEDDPRSYEEWLCSNYYLTAFNSTHTTPKGEVVVAFGRYGYDG